jgi:hypothetical protein
MSNLAQKTTYFNPQAFCTSLYVFETQHTTFGDTIGPRLQGHFFQNNCF